MWETHNQQLQRTFTCSDFKAAWAFMTEVAFYAELADHHPNWSNVYNTVTIHLCTHDAGNTVTEKDHLLAKNIDAVFAKYATKK